MIRNVSGDIMMAGGDTDEFRMFNDQFEPIISINGLSRSTFNCDTSPRGDMICIGGGDGVI